jgi:uncharacterized membrane protein
MSENEPLPPTVQPAAAPRSVEGGQGVEWIKQGWQLFVKNPGAWVAIAVILIVIFVVLSMIPLLGQLAANLLAPVFAAGMLLGAQSLERGGELRIEHLFAGFKQNTSGLIVVGVLYMVGMLVIALVAMGIVGGSALTGGIVGGGRGVGTAAGGLMIGLLVMLALAVPLVMAIWFAPALVVFRNAAPIEALKQSFDACLKNLIPFLVYGVIALVASFVAALPFGLGFLVLIPVLAGSLYASYVDIFGRA